MSLSHSETINDSSSIKNLKCIACLWKFQLDLNTYFQLLLYMILYYFILAWTPLLSFPVVTLSSTTYRKLFTLHSPHLFALNINSVKPWWHNLNYIFLWSTFSPFQTTFPSLNLWGPFTVSLIWYAEIHLRLYFILSFLHFQNVMLQK